MPQVLRILADFTANPVFLETPDGQLLYAAACEAARGGRRPAPGLGGAARPARGPASGPPTGAVLVDVPGGGHGAGAVRARLGAARGRPAAAPGAPDGGRAGRGHPGGRPDAGPPGGGAGRARPGRLPDRPRRGPRSPPEDAPGQAKVLGFKPGEGPLLPVVMRLAPRARPRRATGRCWRGRCWRSCPRWACRSCWAYARRGPGAAAARAALGVGAYGGGRPGRGGAAGGRRAGRAGAGRARPPVVVVGVAGGWAAAGAGLRHAAETATAAQGLPERPWYDARRLDIDLLLWRLREHPDLAAFVDRAIGPLPGPRPRLAARRCCPPWRPIWRTRAARRRRPASSTSTGRPSTTGWPASPTSSARTWTTRRRCWPCAWPCGPAGTRP